MVSICIKSTHNSKLNLIDKYIDQLHFPNIYYTQKKFKNFYNLILHYKGRNLSKFYETISDILCKFTLNHIEDNFIKKQLKYDYFYFDKIEKKSILQYTKEKLSTPFYMHEKKYILSNTFLEHISNNKILYLDGFTNFRLYKYQNFISSILEETINDYVLQKEYTEYVHLLHDYIQLQPAQTNVIHLIYSQNLKLLLDDEKKIISNIDNTQVYISDISFSSNDFILNTLLALLPQHIYIHSNETEDNFIKFLKLIFNDRFTICNNCKICTQYFASQTQKTKK